MKFKNKHVLDVKKRSKITAIMGIILLIISFVFFYLLYIQDKRYDENIKKLTNDISEKPGKKDYLYIRGLSFEFDVYGDTDAAFYFSYDGSYFSIVYLSKQKAKELYNKDLQNNPVKITGIRRFIPDTVKNFIVEDYNRALANGEFQIEEGEEKLTNDNFYKFFGNTYLDETQSKSSSSNTFMSILISTYMTIGILTFVIGTITTVFGIILFVSISLRLKKISDSEVQMLDNEMSHSDSFYYDKAKVYLTPNYLILLDGRIIYYKYSDILWMYSYELRYRGVRKAIEILTKDARTTMFKLLSLSSETNKEIYDEIWNTIASKNPNIKLGYNTENVKYFREVVRDIKNYNR